MSKRIGLDVGGVIIDGLKNDGTDTDIRGDNFMKATPVDGVYESVKQLVGAYGSGNVFIVSKCGEVIEGKTRKWLAGNDFYGRTGFSPMNVLFCRTKADKTPIVRELGLTDFVDDHTEVLNYMIGIVDRRYLFGPQRSEKQPTSGLIIVKNWEEALASLLQEA